MSNDVLEAQTAEQVEDAINDADFAVVDFFATWCGPCKMVAPMIDVLSGERPHVAFIKADVEKVDTLATKYKIRAVPTLLFFKDGELVDTIVGVQSKSQIDAKIQTLFGAQDDNTE